MFQTVRRWIMKEDLLVKLVYLCIGWMHDGRNKDTCVLCAQIGFPFLWPVYNLLHHSCIIQVKDTCIYKVGVNGGNQTSRYVLQISSVVRIHDIKLHHSSCS